jgi:hypothetical protein
VAELHHVAVDLYVDAVVDPLAVQMHLDADGLLTSPARTTRGDRSDGRHVWDGGHVVDRLDDGRDVAGDAVGEPSAVCPPRSCITWDGEWICSLLISVVTTDWATMFIRIWVAPICNRKSFTRPAPIAIPGS